MASTWLNSWLTAWGNSWGAIDAPTNNALNNNTGASVGGRRLPYPVGDSRPKQEFNKPKIAVKKPVDEKLSLAAIEGMRLEAIRLEKEQLALIRKEQRRFDLASDDEDIEALLLSLTF